MTITFEAFLTFESSMFLDSTACESPCCPSLSTGVLCADKESQTGTIARAIFYNFWTHGWMLVSGSCLARFSSSTPLFIVHIVTPSLQIGFDHANFNPWGCYAATPCTTLMLNWLWNLLKLLSAPHSSSSKQRFSGKDITKSKRVSSKSLQL